MTILDARSGFEIAFDSRGLAELRRRAEGLFLKAARDAVGDTARDVEKRLEAAGAGAGLGRLARAWASKVYPESGEAVAPSGIIFPKGKARTRGAIRAYAEGASIKGGHGQYLAVALPAAGPRFYGRGKLPVTPAEWQRRTGLKLRAAKIGNGLFLVTDGVVGKKTGRVAVKGTVRRLAQGRKVETLLVFRLIKDLTIRQRFSVPAATAGAASLLTANFQGKIAALAAQLNRQD